MRSSDSATVIQNILKTQYGVLSSGRQFEGIYFGTVIATDVISPGHITKGNMTITIPSLSGTNVWGPLPYPGSIPPPKGTTCSVGFGPNNQPIVLAFYNFTAGLFHYGSGAPSSSLVNVGDNYMDTSGHNMYGPKKQSGWGSGTPYDVEPPDIDV